MPIRTTLWKVGAKPEALPVSTLKKEAELEAMIVACPALVSDEWLIIGQQEITPHAGRIDLLALAPDGTRVLLELKRDKTPREVVAQTLDYGAWVDGLETDDLVAIYGRFRPGRDLAADFLEKFGIEYDEEAQHAGHQLVIVASELDDSSERIVNYLNARGIAINVLCFQVFEHAGQQLLSRTWLIDPVTAAQAPASGTRTATAANDPWNGETYVSFGAGHTRSWEDAVQYGFISAGGGAWYSNTLRVLAPGDRVWVNIPKTGYVGVGRVTGVALPASEFTVGGKPVLEVARRATYHVENLNDPERCEYFLPVQWLETVPVAQARKELGFFGNQNSACKPVTPKWRTTVDRLQKLFPQFNKA